MNQNHQAIKRLMSELRELQNNPSDEYIAAPIDDTDMFEWHFSIKGPPETPFEGGIYHGKIIFPFDYPMKPPDIIFLTPNGRFEINKKICLSTTSYHPEEWKPSWSIRALLTAISAFLVCESPGSIGYIHASDDERRRLAKESVYYQCQQCKLSIERKIETETMPKPLEVEKPTPLEEKILKNVKTNKTLFRADTDIPIIIIIIAILVIISDYVFNFHKYFM